LEHLHEVTVGKTTLAAAATGALALAVAAVVVVVVVVVVGHMDGGSSSRCW
jgi:hypothetical protein